MKNQSAVISLFDYSTNMVKPWAAADYLCYCVDLKHPEGYTLQGNIIRCGIDVMEYELPNIPIAFLAAFPPCTHLAASGARWFTEKGLDGLIEGLTLFNRAIKLAEQSNAPYLIENPVGMISTYYRKPDYTFQPWEYGDLWKKRTCLWTGNNFIMPQALHSVLPSGVTSAIHRMSPGPDRAEKRSITPPAFAQLVFEVNHGGYNVTDY
jgi:hypothetical protein